MPSSGPPSLKTSQLRQSYAFTVFAGIRMDELPRLVWGDIMMKA